MIYTTYDNQLYNLIVSYDYYAEPTPLPVGAQFPSFTPRDICHKVKTNYTRKNAGKQNWESVKIRNAVQDSIPRGAIVVPIPNHYGYADYTLSILEDVRHKNYFTIIDALEGTPRQTTLYDDKINGCANTALGFKLKAALPNDLSNVYLFDVVYATGYTMLEAMKVTNIHNAIVFASANPYVRGANPNPL